MGVVMLAGGYSFSVALLQDAEHDAGASISETLFAL